MPSSLEAIDAGEIVINSETTKGRALIHGSAGHRIFLSGIKNAHIDAGTITEPIKSHPILYATKGYDPATLPSV